MAKYTINPAPGTSTGWGRYRSGQEYDLTDEQAAKLRRRGAIGPVAATSGDGDVAPVVDAPGGKMTHIGPKNQPQQDTGEQEKERTRKPGRNAMSVNPAAE